MNNRPHPDANPALFAALLCIIGSACILLADVAGWIVVDGYNPISETISDLAAGDRSWLLDTGIVMFSIGIIALGIALYRWELETYDWHVGAVLMVLLGIVISLIALHNEYGDNQAGGLEIHIYLVYALGILFAIVTGALARGLKRLHVSWFWFSVVVSVLWVILAPPFFFISDAWNGAYERMLGVLMVGWFVVIAGLLAYVVRNQDT